MADQEPTITVPLGLFQNLLNLALLETQRPQIIGAASQLIEQAHAKPGPKLVKDN